MEKDLTRFYEQELNALNILSKEFAKRYPKIAGRLLIESDGGSADPHVERLMQGFAFLTARIQKKIDDTFPEITDALLEILYPQLLRPLPAFTIAHFDVNEKISSLADKYKIGKHTSLVTHPIGGNPCKFRTCYNSELVPLTVKDVSFKPIGHSPFSGDSVNLVSLFQIELNTFNEVDLEKLQLDKLRFYIDTDLYAACQIYELLFNSAASIRIEVMDKHEKKEFTLPASSLLKVGFAENENCLDFEKKSFLGYRHLLEYFAYPEKFLFFDLSKLDELPLTGKSLNIQIFIEEFERPDRLAELSKLISRQTFKLNCIPIINLFEQRAEPIQIRQTHTEYRVQPDRRWPMGVEVYSISEVSRVRRIRGYDDITEIPPLFDIRQSFEEKEDDAFWTIHRRDSFRENDHGSEVYIRLVDRFLQPTSPTDDILTLSTLCCNRDLPQHMRVGHKEGDLYFEKGDPVGVIRALHKPTKTIRPNMGREGYWRLISHLSLNYLSLVQDGREALLEILNLYNFSQSIAKRQEISGVLNIDHEQIMERIGPAHRSAFCQGSLIHMHVDEDRFVGTGAYLFSTILNEFFALYAASNSFTQLKVTSKQREKELATWKPSLGNQPLL